MPQPPASQLNRFRSFGAFGPAYEVIAVERSLPNGDELLRIRLVESGEELLYKRSAMQQDPEAA